MWCHWPRGHLLRGRLSNPYLIFPVTLRSRVVRLQRTGLSFDISQVTLYSSETRDLVITSGNGSAKEGANSK